MSIKSKFEGHPVVFGLTLIAIGFSTGFGVRGYFPSAALSGTGSSQVNCRFDGLSNLDASHTQRLSIMQDALVKLEAQASDYSLIEPYQKKYQESADRIRTDITAENASYQQDLKELSVRCQ